MSGHRGDNEDNLLEAWARMKFERDELSLELTVRQARVEDLERVVAEYAAEIARLRGSLGRQREDVQVHCQNCLQPTGGLQRVEGYLVCTDCAVQASLPAYLRG